MTAEASPKNPYSLVRIFDFFMPRHKMAEGHIEFTLAVCVCGGGCLRVCVFQNRVRAIT